MSNQVGFTEFKVFCKTQPTSKYNIATFEEELRKDTKLSEHILEEIQYEELIKHAHHKQIKDSNLNNEEQKKEDNVLERKKMQKLRYSLEEARNDDKEPTKFYGYEDALYACGKEGSANYALLIFDESKQCFKIVPVEKNFKFEKVKENKDKKGKTQEQGAGGNLITDNKPKASKISQKKNLMDKRFKEMNRNQLLKKEWNDQAEKKKKIQNQRYKEKDIDFDQEFADDESENDVVIQNNEQSKEESDLSENGRKIQELENKNNDENNNVQLNLEFQQLNQDDDEDDDDEIEGDQSQNKKKTKGGEQGSNQNKENGKKDEDNESSLDQSLFGDGADDEECQEDDLDDQESLQQQQIGKRGATQANIISKNEQKVDLKRQRKN